MQTHLADFIKDTPEGKEAEKILRTCVHCGFCLATCPTYQLLGDELDSPRGRIYLMKQMLEGAPVTEKTRLHLDRCLTCRSCETTCPSGVKYGHLVDIGRGLVERQLGRSAAQQVVRKGLRTVLPNRRLFESLLGLGRLARPLLPSALKESVPLPKAAKPWPVAVDCSRTMVVLEGCVQPGLAPNINAAAARVLNRLGVNLVRSERAGCCGAVSYHLNAQEEGLEAMRRNVDAWWPLLEQGAEAIVMTASGCGATVKEYGYLLRNDPAYADKAARISAATRDISEILHGEGERLITLLKARPTEACGTRLAFHSPCTLQHGQKIVGVVETILTAAGFHLTAVPDKHLCCGSAGTYSILQKDLSRQLLRNKVAALESGEPAGVATGNIGCLTHLQTGTALPVKHWIEWVDEVLG